MQHFFFDLAESIRNGRRSAFCVITETKGSTPRKAGSKMIVYENGSISGTVGGGSIELKVIQDALGVIKTGNPAKFSYNLENDLGMHCGGFAEIYIEPLEIPQDLFIFGAGHIGRALAQHAFSLGFRITLFDNREEIWNEFDTGNYACRSGNYEELIADTSFDEFTYVVIVTHKHLFDEDILALCATKPTAYTGMIGSRRKVAEARKRFLSEGLLTEAQLDKVDMPIGIPIAAETPEEIAISILAKLIDVRNKKKEA